METYIPINNAIGEQWTSEQLRAIYSEFGDIRFKNAHIDFVSEGEPRVVSFPIVKAGVVNALLIAYLQINGNVELQLMPASIFEKSNEDLEVAFEDGYPLVALSMFCRHDYFLGNPEEARQLRLQEYRNFVISGRTQSIWVEKCHWIFTGRNVAGGYMDCYWVVYGGGPGHGGPPPRNGPDALPGSSDTGTGGGGNTDNGGGNNWNPDGECEHLPSSTLDYVNSIEGPMPCDDRPIEQIIEEIMQELCELDPRLSTDEVKEKEKELSIAKLGQSLYDKIEAARAANYTNPCEPDMDVVDEVLTSMTGCDEEAFDAALDGVDKIRISNSLKNTCPMVDCIVRNMVGGSDLRTNFVDELLKPCEGASSINLSFTAVSFSASSRDPNAVASSQFTGSNSELVIYLNSDNCTNRNPIDVFETIQHELIHNDIRRRLLEDYGYTVNPSSSYQDALDLLLLYEYGESPTQDEHDLMIDYYLLPAVYSLWEMNGQVGTINDYIGLFLNGFPQSTLINAGYNMNSVLSQVQHSVNFIKDPTFQINSTLFNC